MRPNRAKLRVIAMILILSFLCSEIAIAETYPYSKAKISQATLAPKTSFKESEPSRGASGALKDMGPQLHRINLIALDSLTNNVEIGWRARAMTEIAAPESYPIPVNGIESQSETITVTAKILYVDNLPSGVNAWHFREIEGDRDSPLVIVVPRPEDGVCDIRRIPFYAELLFHEDREDYWLGVTGNRWQAHVLASVEQILLFTAPGELTPYHYDQLKNMPLRGIDFILKENRRRHHEVIEEYLFLLEGEWGTGILATVSEYESLVRNMVRINPEANKRYQDDLEEILAEELQGKDLASCSQLVLTTMWGIVFNRLELRHHLVAEKEKNVYRRLFTVTKIRNYLEKVPDNQKESLVQIAVTTARFISECLREYRDYGMLRRLELARVARMTSRADFEVQALTNAIQRHEKSPFKTDLPAEKMERYVIYQSRTIPFPSHVKEKFDILGRVERDYFLTHEGMPDSYEDIISFDPGFNLTAVWYEKLIEIRRRQLFSLDDVVDAENGQGNGKGNGNGRSREGVFSVGGMEPVEEGVAGIDRLLRMQKATARLREHPVIAQGRDPERNIRMFGWFVGFDVETQRLLPGRIDPKQIAERIGVSRQAVERHVVKRYWPVFERILEKLRGTPPPSSESEAAVTPESFVSAGALKDFGPQLDLGTKRELKRLEKGWCKQVRREKAKRHHIAIFGEDRIQEERTIRAKVLRVDNLPAGIHAWFFREDPKDKASPLVIVVPNATNNVGEPAAVPHFAERIFHDNCENDWKGHLNRYYSANSRANSHWAHILACAEQVLAFAPEGKLTPWHQSLLEDKRMTIGKLQALIKEYSERETDIHHDVIWKFRHRLKRCYGAQAIERIKEYEALFIAEVERVIEERREKRKLRGQTLEYKFSPDIAERYLFLNKAIAKLKQGYGKNMMSLALPSADASRLLIEQEFPESSTKVVCSMVEITSPGSEIITRLWLGEQIASLFEFHNLSRVVVSAGCRFNLAAVIAHLGALKQNDIRLYTGEGFRQHGYTYQKKGTDLIVRDESVKVLSWQCKVKYTEPKEDDWANVVTALSKAVNGLLDDEKNEIVAQAIGQVVASEQLDSSLDDLESFDSKYGKYPGYRKWLRRAIEGGLERKGKYLPTVARYLGVPEGFLSRKIKVYGIDLNAARFNEARRLQVAIEEVIGLGRREALDAAVKTMDYPDWETFERTYEGDMQVAEVMANYDLGLLKVKVAALQARGGERILSRALEVIDCKNVVDFEREYRHFNCYKRFMKRLVTDAVRMRGKHLPLVTEYLGIGINYFNRVVSLCGIKVDEIRPQEHKRLADVFESNGGWQGIALKDAVLEMSYQDIDHFWQIFHEDKKIRKIYLDYFIERLRQRAVEMQQGAVFCIVQETVQEMGFLNIESFELEFGDLVKYQDCLRSVMYRALVSGNWCRPAVYRYLGISYDFMEAKIEEYGFDADLIKGRERKLLGINFTLARSGRLDDCNFERTLYQLGYPSLELFRSMYQDDSEVTEIMRNYFSVALRLAGGNIPCCACRLNIPEDYFKDWIDELDIDARALSYDRVPGLDEQDRYLMSLITGQRVAQANQLPRKVIDAINAASAPEIIEWCQYVSTIEGASVEDREGLIEALERWFDIGLLAEVLGGDEYRDSIYKIATRGDIKSSIVIGGSRLFHPEGAMSEYINCVKNGLRIRSDRAYETKLLNRLTGCGDVELAELAEKITWIKGEVVVAERDVVTKELLHWYYAGEMAACVGVTSKALWNRVKAGDVNPWVMVGDIRCFYPVKTITECEQFYGNIDTIATERQKRARLLAELGTCTPDEREAIRRKVSKIEKGEADDSELDDDELLADDELEDVLLSWCQIGVIKEALNLSNRGVKLRIAAGDITACVSVNGRWCFYPEKAIVQGRLYQEERGVKKAERIRRKSIDALVAEDLKQLQRLSDFIYREVRGEKGKKKIAIRKGKEKEDTEAVLSDLLPDCWKCYSRADLEKEFGVSQDAIVRLIKECKLKTAGHYFPIRPQEGRQDSLISQQGYDKIKEKLDVYCRQLEGEYQTAYDAEINISSLKALKTWPKRTKLRKVFPDAVTVGLTRKGVVRTVAVNKYSALGNYIPPEEIVRIKEAVVLWAKQASVYPMLQEYGLIPEQREKKDDEGELQVEEVTADNLDYEIVAQSLDKVINSWLTKKELADRVGLTGETITRLARTGKIDSLDVGIFFDQEIYLFPESAIAQIIALDHDAREAAKEFLIARCAAKEIPENGSTARIRSLLKKYCMTAKEIAAELKIKKIRELDDMLNKDNPNVIELRFVGDYNGINYWEKKYARKFINAEKKKVTELKKKIFSGHGGNDVKVPGELLTYLKANWLTPAQVKADLGINDTRLTTLRSEKRLKWVELSGLTGLGRRVFFCPDVLAELQEQPPVVIYGRVIPKAAQAAFQTEGALKDLGPQLSAKTLKEIEQLTECPRGWREQVIIEAVDVVDYPVDIKGKQRQAKTIIIPAKVIFVSDLPPGVAAWYFREDNEGDELGAMVVVLPMQRNGLGDVEDVPHFEETLYHKYIEDIWTRKLAAKEGKLTNIIRHKAHVIASTKQILSFADPGELTPYHEDRLQQLAERGDIGILINLLTEDRGPQHRIISKHQGHAVCEEIKEYESLFRQRIVELIAEYGLHRYEDRERYWMQKIAVKAEAEEREVNDFDKIDSYYIYYLEHVIISCSAWGAVSPIDERWLEEILAQDEFKQLLLFLLRDWGDQLRLVEDYLQPEYGNRVLEIIKDSQQLLQQEIVVLIDDSSLYDRKTREQFWLAKVSSGAEQMNFKMQQKALALTDAEQMLFLAKKGELLVSDRERVDRLVAAGDVNELLTMLYDENQDHRQLIQAYLVPEYNAQVLINIREYEVLLRQYVDEALDKLADASSVWLYTESDKNPRPKTLDTLRSKAATYLLEAEKKERIRRVWGFGSSGNWSVADIFEIENFLASCAQRAQLPEHEVSLAVVYPNEREKQKIGFSSVGSPGSKSFYAVTAVGSDYPYELDEERVAVGSFPFTVYLKYDEVLALKEQGEKGEEALATKLKQLYSDSQLRDVTGDQRSEAVTGEEAASVCEQEKDFLVAKHLLQNRLVDCLLRLGSYREDLQGLSELITAHKPDDLNALFRASRSDVLREVDVCTERYTGKKLSGLITDSFGAVNEFGYLLRMNVGALSQARDPGVVAEITSNIYLILQGVEVLSRERKFMKQVREAMLTGVKQGVEVSTKVSEASPDTTFDGQLGLGQAPTGLSPFLIWVGKKTQLAKRLHKFLPRRFNRYFEPFVGAATIFFKYQPEQAILNDASRQLINIYTALRDEPEAVIAYLEEYLDGYHFRANGTETTLAEKQEYYLCVRALKTRIKKKQGPQGYKRLKYRFMPIPRTKAQRAARMIFLNHACDSGLWRFNANGDFNVPFGRRMILSISNYDLFEISQGLQRQALYALDYEAVLEYAQPGDLIYLDPPYHMEKGYKGFAEYSKGGFKEEEQWRLAKVYHELHRRGCFVILSNYNTEFIQKLYQGFDVTTMKTESMIRRRHAGKEIEQKSVGAVFQGAQDQGSDLVNVEEVLVRNFRCVGGRTVFVGPDNISDPEPLSSGGKVLAETQAASGKPGVVDPAASLSGLRGVLFQFQMALVEAKTGKIGSVWKSLNRRLWAATEVQSAL